MFHISICQYRSYIDAVFDQKPVYGEFYPLVGNEISAKWESFSAMIGLTVNDIKGIRASAEPGFRFAEVLDMWGKTYYKKTPFTWRSVIQILRRLKLDAVADAAVAELLKESND